MFVRSSTARRRSWLGLAAGFIVTGSALPAEVANWTAGASPGNYGDPAHWDLGVVPLNSVDTTYVLEIPAGAKVTYDVEGTGRVDALRLGNDASFTLDGARTFIVEGISVLNGPVTATGAGAVFRSDTTPATVSARARFLAHDGAVIAVDAPSYELPEDWRRHGPLFQADGIGSRVDLSGLATMVTRGGHGGAWNYSVLASDGGTVDLSGLTQATGPRTDTYNNDDWLTFQVSGGGQLDLGSLTRIDRRVRILPEQDWNLPALESAGMGFFHPAAGVTLDLPEFLTLDGGEITLPEGTVFNAPKLADLRNTTLTVATNAVFQGGQVSDLSGSVVRLDAGGTLDLGTVSTLDRASLLVHETPTLAPAATSYELPDPWNQSWTLFEANGEGVSLDLHTIGVVRTSGGWPNVDYLVRVQNGGHLNLSGLIEAIGPRTDAYQNDDWLSFYINSGGTMDLSGLRTISRKVRFFPEAGEPLNLPALETINGGYIKLLSGSRLDAPALQRMASGGFGAWLDVDFAAEVNAPVLGELNGVHLNVQPGGIVDAPELTNIINTSLAIEPGGRLSAPKVRNLSDSALTLDPGEELLLGDINQFDRMHLIAKATPAFTFSATSYTTPEDWRTHRTPFEADGVGVVLALASLETITIPGAHGRSWITSVTARNGGHIDLSGLQTALGGRTDTYGSDDWLTLRCETGGDMDLGEVTVARVARLQVAGPQSRMTAAGLHLRAPARLELSDQGRLELHGNFDFNHSSEGQMPNDPGVLAFTGPGEHRLEVGGQDAGADGFTAGNFGLGRLEVGAPGAPTTLLLEDALDNGNRGADGEPEALYLYGVDAAGLVLHAGSMLVVGDINVYALNGGTMTRLNDLLTDADTAEFGDGVVARFGGPAIIDMTPSVQALPVVDHVDVTFNTPINEATFTTDDVALTGSSGAIAVTSITPLENNAYRVAFPGQSDHGLLTVRIGPDIADATGRLAAMDQNSNGVIGDPDDAFEARLLVDTEGPAVASAVVLRNSGLLGVRFDEAVEPAGLADPANYAIGGNPPNAVEPRPGDRAVALRFPVIEGDAFTLETVNLADLLGNTLAEPRQAAGAVLPLGSLQVGAPTGVREAYTEDGARFEIKAGGGSVWNTADHTQFYQEARTGDFDVKLRMISLVSAQHWAQLGIMAREHAGNNSRHLSVMAYQPNRANVFGFHRRATQGGGSDRWGADISGVTPPDAWLRLLRAGDQFRAFISRDGNHWTLGAETTFALPETILVGFFVDSEDRNLSRSATAEIAEWGEYSPAILRQPLGQTVFQGQTARLAVEARGVGELSYQWRHDGAPLPDATNAILELPNIQPAQAGDYLVVVENAIGTVTSETARVVVDSSDPGAGIEADLMPRDAADGAVGVADWTMVGRLAVGLETPANASEFTRADCAPRSTLGNGVIGVTDWVQAGRYVAGLEPPTPAGGPNGVSPLGLGASPAALSAARELSLVSLPGAPELGRTVVRLRALGDENSVSFSVGFDATQMELLDVAPGRDAARATLLTNRRQAPEGSVGVALALPPGMRFAAGDAELVVVSFRVLRPGAPAPVWRQTPVALAASDRDARPLELHAAEAVDAGWGRLHIARLADGAGVRVEFTDQPGSRVILETSTDLIDWEPAGEPVLTDAEGKARFTETADGSPRFFRIRRAD